MGKRNWSSVDADANGRKAKAARMRQSMAGQAGECITKVDFALVMAAFNTKSDPDRSNYAPVIVNRRIVR